jgi:hypothetical protein
VEQAPASTPSPGAANASNSNKDNAAAAATTAATPSSSSNKKLQKSGSSAEDPNYEVKGAAGGISRSSSTASLSNEVIASEGVTWLYFADSYSRKNDFGSLSACLWVGTDLGSMIAVVISLPDRGESRTSEPVVVSPSGSLYR